MSKNTNCKNAIKEWMKREKAMAEMKAKEWAEKKEAGAPDEDMPVDADGQLHNPDGSVFTGPKDAKKITLIGMIPPIAKMDKQLNDLPLCEHLGLSTNNIGTIGNLKELRNLKTLSLSRNVIKALKNLDPLADTLEQLWLSYNLLEKLDGLSKLRKLRILYVANNKIADFAEVDYDKFAKLKENTNLEELVAIGNPCYLASDAKTARATIIRAIPSLKMLDGTRIELSEREEAEEKKE